MLRKNFKGAKERRQEEAAIRQQKWAKLTLEQQIEELQARPGNCAKQIARLQKKIADNANKVANSTKEK